MLFPQKVSVFVGKCVYSRYFQGSLYFPPRKRFDNVTAGLHEVLGWQQVLTGREEMETFSSHHYFNLYLSTSLSTCSSPCRLTLARCSLMLRIFLRRIRFIFTYFFFLLFCTCGLGLFSSPSSVSAASFQAFLALNTETGQRQEKAVALTYFGISEGGRCGGLYPNTEPG